VVLEQVEEQVQQHAAQQVGKDGAALVGPEEQGEASGQRDHAGRDVQRSPAVEQQVGHAQPVAGQGDGGIGRHATQEIGQHRAQAEAGQVRGAGGPQGALAPLEEQA